MTYEFVASFATLPEALIVEIVYGQANHKRNYYDYWQSPFQTSKACGYAMG